MIHGDRRMQKRYPIELELEYKFLKNGKVISAGAGRTGNISSGGVLFHAAEGIPQGASVELAVRWPAVLGDAPFVELCIYGQLVRSDSHGLAMRMSKYHFQKPGDPRRAYEEVFAAATIQ